MKKIMTILTALSLTTSALALMPASLIFHKNLGGALEMRTMVSQGPETTVKVEFACPTGLLASFTLTRTNPEVRFGQYNGGMCKLDGGILTLKMNSEDQPYAVNLEAAYKGFVFAGTGSRSIYNGYVAHW